MTASLPPRRPHFTDQYGNTCSNYKARTGKKAREWRRFVVFSDGSPSPFPTKHGASWIAFGPKAGTATITGHHTGAEAIRRAEEAACFLEDSGADDAS